MTDLRGSLGRDSIRSREILRELLGDIRLQPEGEEIYAEFETRPERIFLSERLLPIVVAGTRFLNSKQSHSDLDCAFGKLLDHGLKPAVVERIIGKPLPRHASSDCDLHTTVLAL